ncbi:Stress-induced-phosphoprotein 1 [Phytophthora citrophthora]|uniref:Hsp70-Hsp90 organising protein n=1 Tax=Phytophthora citrophthora TaxID=4793 RepID=A0AAD9GM98_9STRA|nr:Stress-induced-phosphoprotein 1 [Phytophthora citrophthora]
MAADQAKDRGNRAFSAGLYADAVACFSEALAIAPSAPNAHVFYSNRSAAQLKLNKADEALKDADQCIALKPNWPKGYSRRGSALYALGRYADAYRAYKDGLNHEASNAGLLEGLRLVEAKLMTQRAGTSSGSSSSASTPPPAASLKGFLVGSKKSMFQLFQFVLRTLMLLCFVNFWIPVLISSYTAYANFFKLALVNHASYLAFTHGAPKWSAAYAQRLLLDPAAQIFFFCLVFWVSAPHGMALMPIFLLEMVHYFSYMQSLLQMIGLADSSLVTLVSSKALVPLTALIISDPSFPALATRAKWAKLYTRMPQVAANLDVAIGVALILEMLTPARNFLLLVLYWQVLRVRYMISPQLQEAFRSLHATILTLVNHPRCPAVVGSVYGKIHAFAVKMGDAAAQQQQAASGAGGLASRCNIM